MADKTSITSQPAAAFPSPNPPPTPVPATSEKKMKSKPEEPRDTLREIFETVVFVVVLVLLLKTFVAEAFVIPTGSMATTLYGYQKIVTCEKCGLTFPLNCSSEVDPQGGAPRAFVRGGFCPNCQNKVAWSEGGGPDWNSGDRVLVAKFLYDRGRLWTPKRHEVIVFKYPENPQESNTAMNYIKRCEGESEETIAIFGGDLYVTKSLRYEHREPSEKPENRWMKDNMYVNDPAALQLFVDSIGRSIAGEPRPDDFSIVRKPPEVMLALRRIVFHNDFQPSDLAGKVKRWQYAGGSGWAGDDPKMPKKFTHASRGSAEPLDWLSYHHIMRDEILSPRVPKPEHPGPTNDSRRVISNTLGYNTGFTANQHEIEPVGTEWVGDLMLECDVHVAGAQGEFVLELSKGYDRFQARFDLSSGKCKLVRRTPDRQETILDEKDTPMSKTGTFKLRFANFDERLTVWVDSKLPFGDGVVFTPAKKFGPTAENDLEPASIGVRDATVEVSHLQLWRDTYYTNTGDAGNGHVTVAEKPLAPIQTFYVQPGHYFALGDNSSSSKDSRYWGLVPERLLLGRALVVYFPFWPFTSQTRAGLIR